MGKSQTNSKIGAIADAWHASTYDLLYGKMTLTRYSLPNGGDLDNNVPYWFPNPDGHPNGVSFDLVNPSTFNPIPQTQMLSSIITWCGSNHTVPLTGLTLANSTLWHVTCY